MHRFPVIALLVLLLSQSIRPWPSPPPRRHALSAVRGER